MKQISFELKKLLRTKELFIIITVVLALSSLDFINLCFGFLGKPTSYIHSAWETWLGYGNSNAGLVGGGIVTNLLCSLLLPLIATISFSDSYIREHNQGILPTMLSRNSRKQYYLSKIIVVFVCGIAISIIPYIYHQILCLITFPTLDTAHPSNWSSNSSVMIYHSQTFLFPNIDLNFPLLSNSIRVLFIGLYGGVCALVGLALSFIFKKRRLIANAGVALLMMLVTFILSAFVSTSTAPCYYLIVFAGIKGRTLETFLFTMGCFLLVSVLVFIYKIFLAKDEL